MIIQTVRVIYILWKPRRWCDSFVCTFNMRANVHQHSSRGCHLITSGQLISAFYHTNIVMTYSCPYWCQIYDWSIINTTICYIKYQCMYILHIYIYIYIYRISIYISISYMYIRYKTMSESNNLCSKSFLCYRPSEQVKQESCRED